ncbi:MAG: amidohydrolase [Deltaproteobacteria bacterium]|nr:amidohydrolase [Deltaproteobacteria bacterium]
MSDNKIIDILISNGILVSMDKTTPYIKDGAVAVKKDKIVFAGDKKDMPVYKPITTIDAKGGIIMPGLVNTHTHAPMTCFRGLADDLPLMTWLNDYIFPAEANLNPDMVYKGSLLACAEMIMSGTTCFCDMYIFEDFVAKAAKTAGMRALVGEGLFDFDSPNYGPLEKGFDYTKMLAEKWEQDDLISIAVMPHSPYLCAPPLLKKALLISEKYSLPLVIHLSETKKEVSIIKNNYGATPVKHLANIGALSPSLVACHAVVLTEEDIPLLKKHNVKVSHNPQSNMKLASGIAPVPKLMKNGICVGLGTDGCASNNDLDMFSEMDSAAKLHKVKELDPTVLDALTVLKMATVNGASVLGMKDKIGSIETGKKADIIIVDINKPHLTPMYAPCSHLVYSVTGGDVTTSVINGKLIMENRKLLTLDIEKIMADVRDIAKKIKYKRYKI